VLFQYFCLEAVVSDSEGSIVDASSSKGNVAEVSSVFWGWFAVFV